MFFLGVLLASINMHAQSYFSLKEGVSSIEIPFEQLANLIIVPATFNGKATNFILDTGSAKTLLFNWNNIDSLSVNVKSTIKIAGYGERKYLDVYYTEDNVIYIGETTNARAEAYVLVDEIIDLKPQLGIDVNGLIGADFFKNQVVEVDYAKSVLRVYRNIEDVSFSLKDHEKLSIVFDSEKPFIKASVTDNSAVIHGDFLLDTGSSDALWCFENDGNFIQPAKYFEDYLGFGVNGEIFGKRSRIDLLQLGTFKFHKVSTAFPQILKRTYSQLKSSSGSLGGELLRRFRVIFDYQHAAIYLKKSSGFDDGFYFNLSGIQVYAGKMNLFAMIKRGAEVEDIQGPYGLIRDQLVIKSNAQYFYKYVPELYVAYVRKNSPADAAGIRQGDKIISVQGFKDGQLTMKVVNDIFYKEVNKIISLKVERGQEVLKIKFKQVPPIE